MAKKIDITRTVTEQEEGTQLIHLLADLLGHVHHASLRDLVEAGRVTVDGVKSRPRWRLRAHSLVSLRLPAAEVATLRRKKTAPLQVPILFNDEHCLVVAKPAGVPVIPERHRDVATIRDLVEGGGELGVVHRLDRETSGCLILTRSREAMRRLEQQFTARRVEKRYLALARGRLDWGEHLADMWIGPARGRANRMRALSRAQREANPRAPSKEARTEYRAIEAFPGLVLVRARPRTGRTHQVRVHLAAAGLPIVADPLYSAGKDQGLFLSEFKPGYRPKSGQPEKPLLGRLGLHAEAITFLPPGREEQVTVTAPLPADMHRALARLRHFCGGQVDPGEGEA
jgi:RluA family pseudouridine synthase